MIQHGGPLPRNRALPNTTLQRGDTSQVLPSMRSPSSALVAPLTGLFTSQKSLRDEERKGKLNEKNIEEEMELDERKRKEERELAERKRKMKLLRSMALLMPQSGATVQQFTAKSKIEE
ncbi:hypothetical protein TNCV_117191 [Trichonephila clavipes]|nr:hypothetical protein TNCV_117191 [Trichonephila clavipes]